MSERQKYYNSYFAPVVRWEKQSVIPTSKQFSVDTSEMVLLSQKHGQPVKPTTNPVEVTKWVKVLNKPPVDLVDEIPMQTDEDNVEKKDEEAKDVEMSTS